MFFLVHHMIFLFFVILFYRTTDMFLFIVNKQGRVLTHSLNLGLFIY
jgi:hypothetical protein